MTPDQINGCFEALGGGLVLNHCRAVLRAKSSAGVSAFSTAVFALWGLWNLWYYPSLGQWWSFCGGVLIVMANVLWVHLILLYRRR